LALAAERQLSVNQNVVRKLEPESQFVVDGEITAIKFGHFCDFVVPPGRKI